MRNLISLLPKNKSTLLKYLLVVFVLLTLFTSWHNISHVSGTEQSCQLCLSEIDLEHSIPTEHTLFTQENNTYYFILPIDTHFSAVFIGVAGNRDPPFSSIIHI
jgi:hypothetical protein